MDTQREQELEVEVELLKEQLKVLTGSSKELGVLLALRHGITERMAMMLLILVKRAPAVISRSAFHSVIFGHDVDGGPEPKIFGVYVCRLRSFLRQVGSPGKIDTIWSAGYRANPDLVKWVDSLFQKAGIKESPK
jgi:DNA-binding response OmpR family regulator